MSVYTVVLLTINRLCVEKDSNSKPWKRYAICTPGWFNSLSVGVYVGVGVCVLSLDCYWHGWIKTSPASQLWKLFMGLLKGHMPKTSLNRNELTCGIQTVFKTQRWLEWGTSKNSHGNMHKAITDTFQNPVLLPGKSHGRRSLVGCSPWGH